MNDGMTTEDIERIVKLIASTSDPDIKKILKDYLAWSLAAPLITRAPQSPQTMFF